MSKPSEEARQLAYDNPSQDSECRRFMEYLADRHEPVRCDCDHADMERYALAIDALVQRAVERERERATADEQARIVGLLRSEGVKIADEEIKKIVADAVERERERCCRAVCRYCSEGNEPRPARDYDQPMHLFQGYPPRACSAAALRATPNTGG